MSGLEWTLSGNYVRIEWELAGRPQGCGREEKWDKKGVYEGKV